MRGLTQVYAMTDINAGYVMHCIRPKVSRPISKQGVLLTVECI